MLYTTVHRTYRSGVPLTYVLPDHFGIHYMTCRPRQVVHAPHVHVMPLKDGTITDDVDGWATRLRAQLPRNLPSTFPRRALKHLCERQRLSVTTKLVAKALGDAIPALPARQWRSHCNKGQGRTVR